MNEYKVTLKYLLRYPESKKTKWWQDQLVYISTDRGIWRINGQGYTYPDRGDAWVLPLREAFRITKDLGPEKLTTFYRVII